MKLVQPVKLMNTACHLALEGIFEGWEAQRHKGHSRWSGMSAPVLGGVWWCWVQRSHR